MKLELIVATGDHQGDRVIFDRPGAYHIGRGAGNDLTLVEDDYISRQHCQIELTPAGTCLIRDTARDTFCFSSIKEGSVSS